MAIVRNEFPYTNFHELNLDWILSTLNKFENELQNFIALNTVKYANPIQWDITTQYAANTVVVNNGIAYLSTQPVPLGVDIANADYWMEIFSFKKSYDEILAQIAPNEENNVNSRRGYKTGEFFIWKNEIYETLKDISENDKIIDGVNVEKKTLSEILYSPKFDINIINKNTNINSEGDITIAGNHITENAHQKIEHVETEKLLTLNSDKYKIVFPDKTINMHELIEGSVSIKNIGAVGDGVADDSESFIKALSDNDIIFMPSGTYKISCNIDNVRNKVILGGYGAKIETESGLTFRNFENIQIMNVEIDGMNSAEIALNFNIGHNAFVNKCHIHHGSVICLQFSAADGVTVSNCIIHDTVGNNSNTCVAFNVPVGYPEGYEKLYSTVENCEVYNGGLDGIIANMHNIIVKNCFLHHNGTRTTAAGIYANSKYNHIYSNNQIENNTGNGIDFVDGGNLLIESNIAQNNDGSGLFCGGSTGLIMTGNIINGNGKKGIEEVQSAGIGIGKKCDSICVANNRIALNKIGLYIADGCTGIYSDVNLISSNETEKTIKSPYFETTLETKNN